MTPEQLKQRAGEILAKAKELRGIAAAIEAQEQGIYEIRLSLDKATSKWSAWVLCARNDPDAPPFIRTAGRPELAIEALLGALNYYATLSEGSVLPQEKP